MTEMSADIIVEAARTPSFVVSRTISQPAKYNLLLRLRQFADADGNGDEAHQRDVVVRYQHGRDTAEQLH